MPAGSSTRERPAVVAVREKVRVDAEALRGRRAERVRVGRGDRRHPRARCRVESPPLLRVGTSVGRLNPRENGALLL
jgi:hypothetical protein